MLKREPGGSSGTKFSISLGPWKALSNCAKKGTKTSTSSQLMRLGKWNGLPEAEIVDMMVAMVRDGNPEIRKKVYSAVVFWRWKLRLRKDTALNYWPQTLSAIWTYNPNTAVTFQGRRKREKSASIY
uniref:Uncharacterized protein n=1 Tax=Monodelphis domestica TaxID=13616 RepID=A0A5F8H7F8_MONDO